MEKKILLLNPPSPPYMNVSRDWAGGMGTASPSSRPFYGHDIGYELVPYMSLFNCAAILEHAEYNLSFLDGQAEGLNLEFVIDRVKIINPSVLITVVNLPSIYGDLKLMQEIKNKLPTLKIIAIGTVCKILNKLIMESGAIDVTIQDDPEVVILDLLDSIENKKPIEIVKGIAYRKNGDIFLTLKAPPLDDLDFIPFVPYHILPMDKYRSLAFKNERFMMIYSSRGCPFKCSYYCPYPLGFGKRVIFKNPSKVVDEIQLLREKYGVRGIIFRDQNFTMNESHVSQICDELIRRVKDIRWICETRLNLVDKALLNKMRSAGCEQINFGFETGDPELFAKIGKPSGGDLNNVINVINWAREMGIKTTLHVMVGLPGESRQTIRKTVETLKKLQGLLSGIGVVAIATPYPGTKFYEDLKKENLLLTEDWSKFTGFQPVAKTEHLTVKELLRAKEFIEDSFYYDGTYSKYSKLKSLVNKTFLYIRDGTFHKRCYKKALRWLQYIVNPNKV